MRVFSVEMLVKEEGAAVVEAALKRLKSEANAVAAQMKVTTTQVASTGRAMKEAGQATEVSGTRAAKAAIGFAAVGQSLARTGSLTADAGTRIIEAGSHIAAMFGPGGLAVGALLGFAAAAISSFGGAAREAKKMREDFEKELAGLARSNDLVAAKEQLRDLMYGTVEGAIEVDDAGRSVLNLKDGMIALQREIRRINALPFGQFVAQRGELRRLNQELQEAAGKYARLQDVILARGVPTRPAQLTAAPITTVTARLSAAAGAASPAGLAAAAGLPKAADVLPAIKRDFDDLLRVKIPEAVGPLAGDMSKTVKGQMAEGIVNGIEGGLLSGIEMMLASGNIAGAFKVMGQAIVKSMASAMAQAAVRAIDFGKMLAKIQTLMVAHPMMAVAAAIAMLTLARSLGGSPTAGSMVATGGPGGLSYAAAATMTAPASQIIFGATSATTAAGMTPRSATNVTIIGPNDPSAQRAMQELLAKAESRGRIG